MMIKNLDDVNIFYSKVNDTAFELARLNGFMFKRLDFCLWPRGTSAGKPKDFDTVYITLDNENKLASYRFSITNNIPFENWPSIVENNMKKWPIVLGNQDIETQIITSPNRIKE